MIRSHAAAAAFLVLSATAALSQQVTGGSLTFSHSAFTEDTDFSHSMIAGSVEFGIHRGFSIQTDLAFSRLNAHDETVTHFTVHGINHLSEDTSIGLYLGHEEASGDGVSWVGVEMGHQSGNAGFELYAGTSSESISLLGLSTRYDVNDSLAIGVSVDHADSDLGAGISGKTTRYGLNGHVAVTPNLKLIGEVGAVRASVAGLSGTEAYVKLGGKVTFGNKRGATFGQRSVLNAHLGL